MNSKFICTLMILGLLAILFANAAFADDPHGVQQGSINNYYDSNGIASAISAAHRAEVRAAAAGQTNYKATEKIQWSIGSAFAGGESALNLGIGYQAGNVFIAGGVTDNVDTLFTSESDPLYTFTASGTF